MFKRKQVPLNITRGVLNLTSGQYRDFVKFLQITEEDIGYANAMYTQINEFNEELSSKFYETVNNNKDLQKIIDKHTTITKLKEKLKPYILEIFEGKLTDTFIAKREKVAQVHAMIGLDNVWYMGALQTIRSEIIKKLINRTT